MAKVVYWVQDLMFSAKLREAAKETGVELVPARQPEAVKTEAASAAMVVLDLRLPGALEALDLLAADPATKAIPKVGFIDHERLDVIDAATAKGCTQVLSKGKFSTSIGAIFAGL